MLRRALGVQVWLGSVAFFLNACGAIISADRVEGAKTQLSNLAPVQKAMIENAVNDGIYYRIHAKYERTGAKINLFTKCFEGSRLNLASKKRAAVLFAGLKAPNQEKVQHVPVFGYVFDDTEGPRKCWIQQDRVDFVPSILLHDVFEDIQVSLAYRYLERTDIPFGEIASLINGVTKKFGGLPAVLTASTISRIGSNLEREISERYSSAGDDNFSLEFQLGSGRANLTEFKVLLFYREDKEPPQPAGELVFRLRPLSTLSNATPDPKTGAPKFDTYIFDLFPDVSHPINGSVKLKAVFNDFVKKLEVELPKVKEEEQSSLVSIWCDQFATGVRSFNLNHYDSGYVLWSALKTGLPKLFNLRPDYSGFNCLYPYRAAIKAAGLPLKDRDELITDATAIAVEAVSIANQTLTAATLIQGAGASATAVSSTYSQAATAADAAKRATSAAKIGFVPAARAAAEEAASARESAFQQFKNNPNRRIQLLAIHPRLGPPSESM